MLTYTYEARNSTTGQKIKADVKADSEQSAVKLLIDQGLTPISVKLKRSNASSLFQKVRSKDKVLFSRQLATLINAGLPLVQSLRSLLQQTNSKPLREVITAIIADVEGGMTLSDALNKHPKVFNRLYVSLIAAGET